MFLAPGRGDLVLRLSGSVGPNVAAARDQMGRSAAAAFASMPGVSDFEALFPLFPGEQVTSRSVEKLARPWHRFPAGTVLYRRRSDVGEVILAARPAGSASVTSPRPEAAAAIDDDAVFGELMNASLTFAVFAGFAMGGPAGLVVAGGATVLQQVFALLGKKQSIPESELFLQAVEKLAVHEDLNKAFAAFKTNYDWFSTSFEKEWQDGATTDPDEFTRFKSGLAETLGPNSTMIDFINLLEEDDYAKPGFAVFLTMAGFHLVLLKIDLILNSIDRQVVDAPEMQTYLTFADQYIKQASTTTTSINADYDARLSKISDVSGSGSNWNFLDSGDISENPNGVSYTYSSEADAEMMRDTVVAEVTAQLDQKYFNGRKDTAEATQKKWAENRDTLASFQKSTS